MERGFKELLSTRQIRIIFFKAHKQWHPWNIWGDGKSRKSSSVTMRLTRRRSRKETCVFDLNWLSTTVPSTQTMRGLTIWQISGTLHLSSGAKTWVMHEPWGEDFPVTCCKLIFHKWQVKFAEAWGEVNVNVGGENWWKLADWKMALHPLVTVGLQI